MTPLAPIIESLVAGAVLLVGLSLWFTDRILKREAAEDTKDPRAMRAAIAEQRRVLNVQRAYWSDGLASGQGDVHSRNRWQDHIEKIDTKLLAIADEEAKIPMGDGEVER